MKRRRRPPRPDAPAWVHRAWERIAEDGMSISAAAKGEGKHPESLRYHILAGQKKRMLARTEAWQKENRERYNALARESRDRRCLRDPEGFRAAATAAARAWRRKPEQRGTCRSCGGMMGIDSSDDGICQGCREDAAEAKRGTIERLWNEGKSLKEIAKAIGTSTNVLGSTMSQMRKSGNYSLPHRRGRPHANRSFPQVPSRSLRRGVNAGPKPKDGDAA